MLRGGGSTNNSPRASGQEFGNRSCMSPISLAVDPQSKSPTLPHIRAASSLKNGLQKPTRHSCIRLPGSAVQHRLRIQRSAVQWRSLVQCFALLALGSSLCLAEVIHVVPSGGSDDPSCGKQESPCGSIGYAISNQSSEGDTVMLEPGLYGHNTCLPFLCIVHQPTCVGSNLMFI